ncbi:MAG: hypothetical protein M0038_05640 [Pseudomonadota bacterium]|jgi:hypothetical protein|nr:hypothetical protein [Pseudomonadota bacterium]
MTTHNFTLGATYRRLLDLGYSPTSAATPTREDHFARAGRRESFIALADHPAAVQCHPTAANGAHESLTAADCVAREVPVLVLTGYLLADTRQSKAVQAVLADYGLLAGPVHTDDFGNQIRPLRWSGRAILDGEFSARLVHDDDDTTVCIRHALAPTRFQQLTDQFTRTRNVPLEPVGSHIIPLDGRWESGSLLHTPREKLPELPGADLDRIISEVETARWGGRPAATKGAAAA